jgi:uncharacterized protein YacL
MLFVLILIRTLFVGLLTFIGYDIAAIFKSSPIGNEYTGPILGFSIGITIIAVETRLKPIFRKTTFAIIIGLVIGLTSSYLLTQILSASFLLNKSENNWFPTVQLLITFILTYLSISTVLQTKDRFKFIIPYFEFRGQKFGSKIVILDISVLMDSRIVPLLKTNIFDGQIGLPKLAFNELKIMSESTELQKKIRGMAGLQSYLEILSLTQPAILEIEDDHLPGDPMAQIIRIAEMHQGKILTADIAVTSEASTRHVEVININDVAKSFHPPHLPGENLELVIIKSGDNKKQGIGYLEDATLVVVENGKDFIGKKVKAEITQYLQRSSGNMYFANFMEESK